MKDGTGTDEMYMTFAKTRILPEDKQAQDNSLFLGLISK